MNFRECFLASWQGDQKPVNYFASEEELAALDSRAKAVIETEGASFAARLVANSILVIPIERRSAVYCMDKALNITAREVS